MGNESKDPIYYGYFVEDEADLRDCVDCKIDGAEQLDRPVHNQHVTFGFRKPIPDSFRTGGAFLAIGYGNDGKNEGVLVEAMWYGDEDENHGYLNEAPMHITLSLAEGAKPVDTGRLEFRPLADEEQFIIWTFPGRFDPQGVTQLDLPSVNDRFYNLGILEFVWDIDKARNNPSKHDGVTFEEAASAFFDQRALMYSDDEQRYVLIGMSQQANLLLVAHCHRGTDGIIRIISAFKAGKKESDRYENRKR